MTPREYFIRILYILFSLGVFGLGFLSTIIAAYAYYDQKLLEKRLEENYGIDIEALVKWWEWGLFSLGIWAFFTVLVICYWVFFL